MRKSFFFISASQVISVLILLLGSSCSQTRRLTEGEYLLDKSKIHIDNKELEPSLLEPYQKQVPNKQILGVKFHLFLYNLAKPTKDKGFSGWFKKIGEEPVIWNSLLSDRSTEQFQRYLKTKGYYASEVKDSVYLNKKRAKIAYYVTLNEPHRLRSIEYDLEDQKIGKFIYQDTANSLMRIGERFDYELLDDERQRIELNLKDDGFYKFSKEFIFFKAEEVPEKSQVDLKVTIKENIAGNPDPVSRVRHHDRYKIYSAYMFPNYNEFVDESLKEAIDTVKIEGNNIIYKGKHRIRPEPILLPNRCNPGDRYKLSEVKNTYRNYSSLGLYRLVNIHFNELNTGLADTSEFKYLNCFVELSPRRPQSYQTEIVGTHATGDLGARINFSYTNHNLLRGAENFQIKLTGAIEDLRKQEASDTLIFMKEAGVEATLTLPKFLVPFPAKKFTARYNPRTSINVAYNYQNRPKYIRTIASTSISYLWKANSFSTHQIAPLEFNFVRLPQGIIDSVTANEIEGTFLENSFTDHTILAARYTFRYTTQVIEKKKDFIYLRLNLESAGNLIRTLNGIFPNRNDTNFMGVPYFQYLKADADYQIHNQLTPSNKIVYRIFTGVGYPIGNSKTLPFEKMYFAGGPNGIRAWNTAFLGPGSFSDTSNTVSYASRLGDIRLEANIEYRFKLFWLVEGAFFVDVGNVWTANRIESREGSEFKFNRFYKELAVGTGLGARFDFSFLLIRADFGFKLRDPALKEGSRWIGFNKNDYEQGERFTFQFGIGYPF